jgi:hypothetical protein
MAALPPTAIAAAVADGVEMTAGVGGGIVPQGTGGA